jgi:hypothetical protein
MSQIVQCPCGAAIEDSSRYRLLLLKKELFEIDILCPNEACYLRELGYVRFMITDHKAVFREGAFYPPFVTWNSTQLGREESQKILKEHLKEIVTRYISWTDVAEAIRRTAPVKQSSSQDTDSTGTWPSQDPK